MDTVLPGDVLVIRDSGVFPWLIHLQERLMGKPSLWDHVAVFSHTDAAGTSWVIEGRPSGVGWENAEKYLADSRTISNAAQPKSDVQRAALVAGAKLMLGTSYDWGAIAELGAEPLRITQLWLRYREWGCGDKPPVHVICSSFADWLYQKEGLANPGGLSMTRFTTPADWAQFIEKRRWDT